MTNEQIASKLYEIHDRLCRSLSAIEVRVDVLKFRNDPMYLGLCDAADGVRIAALDVLHIKKAIEAEQKQEDKF